jgi:hypothetical protein
MINTMNAKIKKFLTFFAISLVGVLICDVHALSGAKSSRMLASKARKRGQRKVAKRRRMRLRKKLRKKKKRLFRAPKARGKARQRKKQERLKKAQTLRKFSTTTGTPGSAPQVGTSMPSAPTAASPKIDDSVLLNNWGTATGADVKLAAQWSAEEVGQKVLQSDDLLIATAALQDQSQTGSGAWKFASNIFELIEQYVESHLKDAGEELSNFQSAKSTTKFTKKELNWIRFLYGATVPSVSVSNEGFCYVNGRAFRSDSDGHLEEHHDYVQVVFPNWSPSNHANQDLYIGHNSQAWKDLLARFPHLKNNVRLNMQLNAIRMLHFWKFRFAFQGNKVILVDDPTSVIHSPSHNDIRVTRFIEAFAAI